MTTQQHPIGSPFTATSTSADVLDGIELSGRTALVTGGSSGLGLATVRALSAAGALVLVLARSGAGAALMDLPRVQVVEGFDLADLGSVARTVGAISERIDRIDVLIAAAGVMATPQRPVGPGWDHQLSVNHLGHFALVCRLFPLLARADGARVVVYSSAGHHACDIRWRDPHFLTGYDKWLAYGQSKTANALFAVQLDRLGRRHDVRAYSLHPGKIMTGLQRDLPLAEQIELGWVDAAGTVIGRDFKTPGQGAATGLWAATSPLLRNRGGLYLEDCDIAHIATPGNTMDDGGVQPFAVDPTSAERLWCLTSAITATDLPGL